MPWALCMRLSRACRGKYGVLESLAFGYWAPLPSLASAGRQNIPQNCLPDQMCLLQPSCAFLPRSWHSCGTARPGCARRGCRGWRAGAWDPGSLQLTALAPPACPWLPRQHSGGERTAPPPAPDLGAPPSLTPTQTWHRAGRRPWVRCASRPARCSSRPHAASNAGTRRRTASFCVAGQGEAHRWGLYDFVGCFARGAANAPTWSTPACPMKLAPDMRRGNIPCPFLCSPCPPSSNLYLSPQLCGGTRAREDPVLEVRARSPAWPAHSLPQAPAEGAAAAPRHSAGHGQDQGACRWDSGGRAETRMG